MHVDKKRREDGAACEQERLKKMADAVKVLLECVGEDSEREGLVKTPERYAKALLFFTKGYTDRIEGKSFDELFVAYTYLHFHSMLRCHK